MVDEENIPFFIKLNRAISNQALNLIKHVPGAVAIFGNVISVLYFDLLKNRKLTFAVH